VVPIKSDSEHFPPEGKLRVYRSRTGGNEWEALTKGLPQKDCYVNVLRDAMAVDSLDACGVYFGTTGGQVYASADAGDNWNADCARPAGGALGRGANADMSGAMRTVRVILPYHLRTLAQVGAEVEVEIGEPVTVRRVLDSLEGRYPMLRGTIRDHVTQERRPFLRFLPASRICRMIRRMPPLPDAGCNGRGAAADYWGDCG